MPNESDYIDNDKYMCTFDSQGLRWWEWGTDVDGQRENSFVRISIIYIIIINVSLNYY